MLRAETMASTQILSPKTFIQANLSFFDPNILNYH